MSLLAMDLCEILRSGNGEIGIKESTLTQTWPKGFSLPNPSGKAYSVHRLNQAEYPLSDQGILDSWERSNFTALQGLSKGTKLSHFKFIIHGLEMYSLVNSLDETTAFDYFVKKQLNPLSPLGYDFIPLYPYFFHKKTILSASVVSETLTASFGCMGFILDVPPCNILACSAHDIYTPVDDYFYKREPLHATCPYNSFGEALLQMQSTTHTVNSLETILPKSFPSIEQDHRPYIFTPSHNKKKNYLDTLRLQGMPESEVLKHQGLLDLMPNFLTDNHFSEEDSSGSYSIGIGTSGLGKATKSSWYNEVSLNPVSDITGSKTYVTIRGIFLRESSEKMELFKRTEPVHYLLRVAEAFDLPVVALYDGRDYQTCL